MSLLAVLILAVVQGITEFLPISSDGHLAVTNALLAAFGGETLKDPLEVTLTLHLGTLASVLVFYRRELVRLLGADRRAIWPIIVATIPAVIVGLGIKKGLSEEASNWLLNSPLLAGLGFFVTAAALWRASRRPEGSLAYTELSTAKALGIGVMQALAILPGVSRSGMTISTGLEVGLRRDEAGTFSFLMAVPAIGGAGLLQILETLEKGSTGTPLPVLGAGFVVSMLVGLGALALLLRFLRSGRLGAFVYYLVPLGVAVTAWQLLK
jgi:undecaprenyl-diphosphatase